MGGAIVRDLAKTHAVIAVGRRADRLEALAAETGAQAWVLDVTDSAALASHVAELSRVDVLVHAAARGGNLSVSQATAADWAETFALNVTAPAELTRLALPLIRETSGTVIFIGSGASTRPAPGSAVYTSSKHALRGLADVLRIDEEPHRVRVVTLAPGQTDTEMLRGMIGEANYRPERYIRPESIAAATRYVVDAPADVQITDVAVRPRQEISRL